MGNIKPLKIGDLVAKVPIIQGGMGVGVSRSNLAGTVARFGGIGIISSVGIGFDEEDFETNYHQANLRSFKKHIEIAKEKAKGGIIGANIMVAANHYEETVKEAIKSKIDLIISGAGLPTSLPGLVKGTNVKIAPIVSSSKACKIILKMWDRKDNTTADMIVVEGPKAGGHLGFSKDQLDNIKTEDYDKELINIINIAKQYADKYNKEIPVVAAGGIYTGGDIAKYLNLGANGVQMGTRFVATHECDASTEYKMTYINANEEDIQIVKSPLGLPGRAIRNKFIESVENGRPKITKCYNCLIPCTPSNTPYCIANALITAVKGDVDNGLLFCGSDAYKVDKLLSVEELINELVCDVEKNII